MASVDIQRATRARLCGAMLFWGLWSAVDNPAWAVSLKIVPTHTDLRASLRWKRITDHRGSSILAPAQVKVSHDDEVVILKIDDMYVKFWTTTEERWGFPGHDPTGDMQLKKQDCDDFPPQYYIVRDELSAYSCEKSDKIHYYVARYSRYGGMFLFAKYPKEQRASFDAIVNRISASMVQHARAERR